MSEFDDLVRFARAAEAYCDWVRQFRDDDDLNALSKVHRLLAELQSAWLDVRFHKGFASENEVVRENTSVVRERLGTLPISNYRMIFEPLHLNDNTSVMGWVQDDLADIFADLDEGLQFWHRGDFFDAYWTWDFGYKQHWGRHLVDALTAMYHFDAGHFA